MQIPWRTDRGHCAGQEALARAAHIQNSGITRGMRGSTRGVVGAMAGLNGSNSVIDRRYALTTTEIQRKALNPWIKL